MSLRIAIGVFAVGLLPAACGTIQAQIAAQDANSPSCRSLCGTVPHVYGGTVHSVRMLAPGWGSCPGMGTGAIIAYPLLMPFLALDVLLSVAADTLLLPYTTYLQATRGDITCVDPLLPPSRRRNAGRPER